MPTVFVRRIAVLFILLAAPLLAGAAFAQNAGNPDEGIVGKQEKVLAELEAKAGDLEKRVNANAEDDARLVELRTELEGVSHQLLQAGLAFRPRLEEINGRIEQLGPAPGEGQPAEPDIVASERAELSAEKAEINVILGKAESLSLRVHRLIDEIGQMRRDLFAHLLTKRFDVNYALFDEVGQAFATEMGKLYSAISSWLRFVIQFKLKSILAATFFALLAAIVLLIGGRRLFGGMIDADEEVEEPTYLSRLSVAFWSTLMPTAALGVFLASTYFLYNYFNVLRGDIGTVMTSLFIVIGIVYFVQRLASAVLSPNKPNWRLIPVHDGAARLLLWLIVATAMFTGIDGFLSSVYAVLGSPLSLTVGESLVATVLTGIPVVLIGFVKPFVDDEGHARGWHPLLRFALFFLGGLTIVAGLAGFIGFARFLSAQMVVTGAVLSTMYLGVLSAGAVSQEGAFANTSLGRRVQSRFQLDEATLDQLALVVSIAINIFVLVVGLPLILFLWGFQPDDIRSLVYKFATEIKIGSVSFSITGILTGLLVFVVGYFVTRWFQGWLDGSVMARGRVDKGVRNSIRTVVGYAGIALACLIGISAAGIDLSNLALIAGGLSLGIGFGLQNVVSNFVSGLILLAERPFQVGDWVVAGPVSGTVKKISVRATEIETFQRQTVILPNSELINAAVGNWTHRNKLGRVEIPVRVAYGSDARQVHAILLELGRSHPMVLKNPEPFVRFVGFGESTLDFELQIYLADITSGGGVQNDIRFSILDAFEREHITIPVLSREIVVKSDSAAEIEPERPATPKSGRRRKSGKTDPDGA
jgi:small-conductance mechanosensitive channel